MTGPSKATAIESTITVRKVTGPDAGSVRRMVSRPTSTPPPARASSPAMSRSGAISRAGTAASVRASAGRIREVRRADIRAAAHAPATVITVAAATGKGLITSASDSGIAPSSMNMERSQLAKGIPISAPGIPANTPMATASRPMSFRTCFGVAATARSRASSRYRCWIESAKVPTTTRMATRIAVPDMAPPMLISCTRASEAARNSTAPRSSPEWTWVVSPSRAATRSSCNWSRSTPASGKTPMTATWSGRPDNCSAWPSEKKREDCPVRLPVSAEAMPTT